MMEKHQSNPLLNDVSFLHTYMCKVELSYSYSYPVGPLLLLSHIHLAKLPSKTLSVSLSLPNQLTAEMKSGGNCCKLPYKKPLNKTRKKYRK